MLLEQVKQIVLDASKIMLDDHFVISEKDGASNLVTTNDVKVQEFLQKKLKELLPDSSFFCEEGNVKDLSKDYIWIIDPIDGTTNYANHIAVCAISVALEYKGEIILGIVYNPYQNAMYTAEKGKGAYLNGKPIKVSNRPLNKCVTYTAFSAYDKTQSYKVFGFAQEIFPIINDLRRTGSAAFEICSVAAGRGDIFIELKLQVWDFAAASLVLKEAGGVISTLDIEKEPPLDRPGLVAAGNNKENLSKILEVARKYF